MSAEGAKRSARVVVSLWAESADLTLEEISARVGMTPDRSHSAGDARGRTGKRWAHNGWAVESCAVTADDPPAVADCLHEILTALLRRVAEIASGFAAATAACERGLTIGVIASAAPEISFGAETIAQIAALGVGIEVDLIVC